MNSIAKLDARFHTMLVTNAGALLRLTCRHWLPAGVDIGRVKWRELDPDNRLVKLEGIGVELQWGIHEKIWDITDNVLDVYLNPVLLDLRLSEEAVGLVISLYRKDGWSPFYTSLMPTEWTVRLAQLKAARHGELLCSDPNCEVHGTASTASPNIEMLADNITEILNEFMNAKTGKKSGKHKPENN